MPAGCLPSAERFGLSLDIDRWVIVNAMHILVQHRQVQPDICYSINLSPQTMSSKVIGDVIKETLDATRLDPAALVFEVTENAAIQLLTTLRGYGCRTALDDFGAGMSSFAYLRELPVDYVKIDGRFVKNLAANPVDQAMVRAMNDIAHALGKQTVAEFVEDEASLAFLRAFGVDYVQGYFLGRPDVTIPCKLLAERAGGNMVCRTRTG
jgi:EAL domain-containing protein (putative c-di-GMP-specific phosphodiesterase class I)